MGFYSTDELNAIGFKYIGKDVKISTKASIHNPQQISVGDYSRIDDFCVLSAGKGGINVGRYVHIAVFCSLIGAGNITLNDFVSLSSRVSVYSSNDDYSGNYLTNPTVPSKYTNVYHAPVLIDKHVIIGSGSVVLPGVILEEGVSIGALSLINKNCKRFTIYVGVPAKPVKERSSNLLEYETMFLGESEINS